MAETLKSLNELVENLNSTSPLEIDSSWRQGRTAYGGVTAALSLAAAFRDHEDLPPLRSMQITFVGPVPPSPQFTSRKLRSGKNVTTIAVEAFGDGQVCAFSIIMFGKARTSALHQTLPPPECPTPEECPDFLPKEFRSFAPAFTRQFDMKLAAGSRPASGSDEGYILSWSRMADPGSRRGIEAFICLGDVLPPAAAPMFTTLGPISSMNWQINLMTDEIDSDDGWYLVESRLSAAESGYSSQVMRYWNRKGDLIAEATQSVAIFS